MEDTNCTANLADWGAKAEREARLYRVGLPLFTELNELEATGDSIGGRHDPCDYIPKRSYALFQARAVLQALAEERHSDARGHPA